MLRGGGWGGWGRCGEQWEFRRGTYQDLCARQAWPFAAAEHSWAGNSAASWAGARLCEWQRRWKCDVCDEDAKVEMEGRRLLSGETRFEVPHYWSLDRFAHLLLPMAGLNQAGIPTKPPSARWTIVSHRLVSPGTLHSCLNCCGMLSQGNLAGAAASQTHSRPRRVVLGERSTTCI
jgi:hypothetical protein